MSTPVRVSDRDLGALAAIVSEDRPDLPDGEGLPPSLLADLMDQIRCDAISVERYDSGPQRGWFLQVLTARLSGRQVMINGNALYAPSSSRLRSLTGRNRGPRGAPATRQG
jgi:hypothetical protein